MSNEKHIINHIISHIQHHIGEGGSMFVGDMWILVDAFWNDNGIWIDGESWMD